MSNCENNVDLLESFFHKVLLNENKLFWFSLTGAQTASDCCVAGDSAGLFSVSSGRRERRGGLS